MVTDSRVRMSNFLSNMSYLVMKVCRTAMWIEEMDISLFMIRAQQSEEEKLKERARESERARKGDGDFSHSMSDGHLQFRKKFFGKGSSNALTPKLNKDRAPNPKAQKGGGY
ncbi:hypothetical protein MTR67_022972 [Solanum verrucosum]|uniref:Uncharacterized protein n=1 Tax=Solanum verrucosum TaxID=315347 RepID=A0AAF0TR03_SOLVR|nr:hypothetical protein MTR67_022972 [Solanum verrucosum]